MPDIDLEQEPGVEAAGDAHTPPTDAAPLADLIPMLGDDAPSLRTLQRWVRQNKVRSWTEVGDDKVVRQLASLSEVQSYVRPKTARGGRQTPADPTATEVSVRAWKDSREQIAALREELIEQRREHAREVERLEDLHRDSRRWGRGAIAVAFVAVAAGAWLFFQERERAHAVRDAADAHLGGVEVRHARELATVQERERAAREEAAAERQQAEALQRDLERNETAARAAGEALGRLLVGGN